MGDFNPPAWSHFALRFKRIGGYLDPRLGRGPLPSHVGCDVKLVDRKAQHRVGGIEADISADWGRGGLPMVCSAEPARAQPAIAAEQH